MLNDADASGFKKVYLAMGFTDLRRGIDGLAGIIRFQFNLDPYDKNTLFLFCGEGVIAKSTAVGRQMGSFSCINVWITELSAGPVPRMKPWQSQKSSIGC